MAKVDGIQKMFPQHTFKAERGRPASFLEIGSSGLRRFGGDVREEFLTSLQGRAGIRVYREMRDNDPIIGSSLLAIEQTIRNANWFSVRSDKDDSNLSREAAEYLKQCMSDMSHTWDNMISEICSMLPFGWAWLEIVYKKRQGENKNPRLNSKYNDGGIGWRKISLRMQTSLYEWEFADDDGGIKAMIQQAAPNYETKKIPIEKSLLFRTKAEGNNPEGRSVMRNSYRPWFFKKVIEELEAIGAERDLIGLPVMKPPEGFNIDAPENLEVKAAIQDVIYGLRRDERDGLVLPPGWEIELLSAGRSTRRQFDLDKIITRYDKRIAVSMLTQAIMLGMDRVGSYALSEQQVDDFFLTAVEGYLMGIAEVMNLFAVPQLFRYNPQFAGLMEDNALPKLVPGKVTAPSLKELADYVEKLANCGALTLDDDLEKDLRRLAPFSELRERSPQVLMPGERGKPRENPNQNQIRNPNPNPNQEPKQEPNQNQNQDNGSTNNN